MGGVGDGGGDGDGRGLGGGGAEGTCPRPRLTLPESGIRSGRKATTDAMITKLQK